MNVFVYRDQKNVRLVQPKYNVRCYNIDYQGYPRKKKPYGKLYMVCYDF